MVSLIMELVRNQSFFLTTGTGKQTRLKRLKNGVLQESVLVPLLFNVYTYDLTVTIGRKFSYAVDLAILHCASDWLALERILTQNMENLYSYFC